MVCYAMDNSILNYISDAAYTSIYVLISKIINNDSYYNLTEKNPCGKNEFTLTIE